jgi:hypothetical protein
LKQSEHKKTSHLEHQAIALIGEWTQNEQKFSSDWFDVAGKPLRNICVTNVHILVLSSCMAYHGVCIKNNSMGATGGVEPVFRVVRVVRSLIICGVICRSLFIVFLFVLVHCLSFFDLLF